MSTNGETADLMVRESIQITESAVKLAGLGAKNLAAFLLAFANDQQKVAGKINLRRLIRSGEELAIFSIKEEDLTKFQQEGKRYGILYCPIVNKLECTGTIEIMARARDARQINHVLERMGYPVPREWEVDEKKQKLPVLSGNNLSGHENGVKVTEMETAIEERERQSVKEKLETLKAASKLTEKVTPTREVSTR